MNKNMIKRMKNYPNKSHLLLNYQSFMEKINVYYKNENISVPELISKLFIVKMKILLFQN